MTGILALARVRGLVLLVGVSLVALPAARALADTTIGQTGGNASLSCFGPLLWADTNYVVPSGGIITSFSFQSTTRSSGEQLDFLVLRPTATAGSYTVVGQTGVVTLAGTGSVETFAPPVHVPVQGGDILGFWVSGPSLGACVRTGASGGGEITSDGSPAPPDPSVGDTVSLPNGRMSEDLNESANFLPSLPTSKAQCKNGGWKSFGDQFKNQGDCVSFVATGGNNPPSGS